MPTNCPKFLLEMDDCQESTHHVIDAETGERIGGLTRWSDGSVGYYARPGNRDLLDVWSSLAEGKAAIERNPDLIRAA